MVVTSALVGDIVNSFLIAFSIFPTNRGNLTQLQEKEEEKEEEEKEEEEE